MRPRNLILILGISMPLVAMANSGEARFNVGYGFGETTLEDSLGDELSAEVTGVGVSGTYFAGEQGPFIGVSYLSTTLEDFEFNNRSTNFDSQDSDEVGARIGYRGGSSGAAQPYVAALFNRASPDEGSSETSVGAAVGIEQSSGSTRLDLSASYLDTDGGYTATLGPALTLFLTPELGVNIGASYSTGETELLGDEVDTTGYQVQVGAEVRFR